MRITLSPISCSHIYLFSLGKDFHGGQVPIGDQSVWDLYWKYEGWNFNSGNYLFTIDTK